MTLLASALLWRKWNSLPTHPLQLPSDFELVNQHGHGDQLADLRQLLGVRVVGGFVEENCVVLLVLDSALSPLLFRLLRPLARGF